MGDSIDHWVGGILLAIVLILGLYALTVVSQDHETLSQQCVDDCVFGLQADSLELECMKMCYSIEDGSLQRRGDRCET